MKYTTTVIQASIRGNKEKGIPNQDFIQVIENDDLLISAVSDGLSSSKNSFDGAKMASKTVIDEIKGYKLAPDLSLLNEQIKTRWENEINKLSDAINDFRTTNSFVAVFKTIRK